MIWNWTIWVRKMCSQMWNLSEYVIKPFQRVTNMSKLKGNYWQSFKAGA